MTELITNTEVDSFDTKYLLQHNWTGLNTDTQKQKEEVITERKSLSTGIDEDLVSLYDRLMKSKGGDAVVSSGSGQCGGCHMKLIPSTMISVQAAKEVTQCENCGRILYM